MSGVSSFSISSRTENYSDQIKCNSENGAMLMLAEVASRTLQADSKASRCSSPASVKRKKPRDANGMPLNQAKMLSVYQLLRTFSKFHSDEIRRLFYYTCLLQPEKCSATFESFGSETKAKNLLKEHLQTHLEQVPEGEVLQVPSQQETICKKSPTPVNKPKRVKVLKPVDSKDLEISEVPNDIFSPMMLQECYEELQVSLPDDKEVKQQILVPNDTVLVPEEEVVVVPVEAVVVPDEVVVEEGIDHDYLSSANRQNEYTDIETIWLKSEVDDNNKSNVTNYVLTIADVAGNPEMMAVSNEVIVKTENEAPTNQLPSIQIVKEEPFTIKSNVLPVLQSNRAMGGKRLYEETCVERDEYREHKKPKGKAKFIGQSAAEKEMAIRMIEAMKLRQGSSEPLECQICVPPRVFTALTTLISHYRSHAGIKPYECNLCGSAFTRQHSLNYHMLIHNNETRFTCSVCGRKFRHPSHFKEHQRKHTGEAPFECSTCKTRFKTRNTYKRHLRTRHGLVLIQSGEIICLSEEEFQRVKTAPRSLQTRASSDKENSRRPKTVNLVRRNKQHKADETDQEVGFVQKYTLNGNWSPNLLEPEGIEVDASQEAQAVAIMQAVEGMPHIGSPTTVVVLTMDNSRPLVAS